MKLSETLTGIKKYITEQEDKIEKYFVENEIVVSASISFDYDENIRLDIYFNKMNNHNEQLFFQLLDEEFTNYTVEKSLRYIKVFVKMNYGITFTEIKN